MKQFRTAEDFRHPRSGQSALEPIEGSFPSKQLRDAPMPDRRYVVTFLDAINNGWMSEADAFRLANVEEKDALTDGTEHINISVPALAHYRGLLSALIADPEIADPKICMALSGNIIDKVVAAPIPVIASGKFSISYRAVKIPTGSVLEWALVLLLGSFVDALCQCHLPSCRKFFLVEPMPRGRPRREYCSDKHRRAFFKKDGAMRTNASRAGVTTDEWRRIKEKSPNITPTAWKNKSTKSRV